MSKPTLIMGRLRTRSELARRIIAMRRVQAAARRAHRQAWLVTAALGKAVPVAPELESDLRAARWRLQEAYRRLEQADTTLERLLGRVRGKAVPWEGVLYAGDEDGGDNYVDNL